MRNLVPILAFCLFFILRHKVHACSCIPQPNITTDMLCKAPFATHVRIVDRFLTSGDGGDPNSIVEYTVAHVTVYKAPSKSKPSQWVDGSKGYMVTHSSSATCGMSGLTIGTEIVVIGNEWSFQSPIDGKPLPANTFAIGLCGKNPYWNTLPETERQILAEFKKLGEKCSCKRQI